jgi:hypothetical protein
VVPEDDGLSDASGHGLARYGGAADGGDVAADADGIGGRLASVLREEPLAGDGAAADFAHRDHLDGQHLAPRAEEDDVVDPPVPAVLGGAVGVGDDAAAAEGLVEADLALRKALLQALFDGGIIGCAHRDFPQRDAVVLDGEAQPARGLDLLGRSGRGRRLGGGCGEGGARCQDGEDDEAYDAVEDFRPEPETPRKQSEHCRPFLRPVFRPVRTSTRART